MYRCARATANKSALNPRRFPSELFRAQRARLSPILVRHASVRIRCIRTAPARSSPFPALLRGRRRFDRGRWLRAVEPNDNPPPKALSWLGSMRRMRDFPYLVMGSTAAGGLGCRFRRALAASCARDGDGSGHFFALSGLEHFSGAAHQRVRGVETSTLPSLVAVGRRYRIQSVCDCERSTISERALSSGRRG